MKKILPSLLMFALLIYLLPLAPILFTNTEEPTPQTLSENLQNTDDTQQIITQPDTIIPLEPELPNSEALNSDILLIYNEATQVVDTVTMRDYVIGSVAAEMPMSYNDEALKAQAVASLSYALALKRESNGGDPNLDGAYFSANPSLMLGYMTDEVMQSFWGDAYAGNKARLEGIVDSLEYKILTYDHLPILACYHAISTGFTRSAEEVWGSSLPYLISVESPYDITHDEYLAEMSFSTEEMISALRSLGVEPQGGPLEWFTSSEVNAHGYTTSVSVNTSVIDGQDFRVALGLRSTAFEVNLSDANKFIITTRGYGHGVGLSQYGANAMALAGKTHEEILMHYFPNTEFSYAV